jgi:hypothetical protein
MTVLESVEKSLEQFRPKNRKEFVVLQIAQRFGDVGRLARYLNAAADHPKNVLLEAARLAAKRAEASGQPAPLHFFDLLEEFRKEAA